MLVAFLLCAFKGGLQTLLDEFFSALHGRTLRAVSKSAVSQARQKLYATAFEALNDKLLSAAEALLPEPRWRGFRLMACDSTTLRLPNWREIQAEFGVQSDRSGQPYVLARALGLFSTASRLMVKTALDRFDASERALLVSLLPCLDTLDLLVMDRGFPAVWLFTLLQQRGIACIARIDQTGWPEVEQLLRSDRSECVVRRTVSGQARRQAQAAGASLVDQTVTLRFIKVVLPNGTLEVLVTSLLDTHAYPAAEFGALYHARWNIEEAFKLIKHRLLLEQFSGELPESIRQDFHAKVFTANLAEALGRSAYEALPDAKAARYYPNLTYILNSLKPRLFCWLIRRVSAGELLTLLDLCSYLGAQASRTLFAPAQVSAQA